MPFLFDLDGTLYTDRGALPGAIDALATLRKRGVPFRFVTNTTRRCRRLVVERLRSYGFEVEAGEVFTSVMSAVSVLREMGARRLAPFVARATHEDLADFQLVGGMARQEEKREEREGIEKEPRPDVVLVGDLGPEWTAALLNEAFRYLLDGAGLVALQKDRFWLGPTGLEMDAGPFVAALEFASGAQAIVTGKPNPRFYQLAAEGWLSGESGERSTGSVVMVGDDLWADVDGAQRAGLQGWLVKTGKFREDVLRSSGVVPDRLLGSVVEVVGATGAPV